ncbi:DNA-methyltransferase [Methylorubrum extorquens]
MTGGALALASAAIGLEDTPAAFVAEMVAVFRDVRRVLRKDGTLWLNLGDSYANDGKWGGSTGGKHAAGTHGQTGIGRRKITTGLKPKDRMMIPARVALALQSDGWWMRDEIVWHKPNPMPSSVTDRTTPSHEMVYMLSRSARYHYDAAAIKEPAVSGHPSGNGFARPQQVARGGSGNAEQWQPTEFRNKRLVWTVPIVPFAEAHFATFPANLIEDAIKAGCPAGGVVLDPFGGAGTTGLVADRLGRDAILIELNPAYAAMARDRLARDGGMFASLAAE